MLTWHLWQSVFRNGWNTSGGLVALQITSDMWPYSHKKYATDRYMLPVCLPVGLVSLHTDNVTLSESSNGCWRHTCLGTTALCDIFSQGHCLAIILLTYLLTYIWTPVFCWQKAVTFGIQCVWTASLESFCDTGMASSQTCNLSIMSPMSRPKYHPSMHYITITTSYSNNFELTRPCCLYLGAINLLCNTPSFQL